MQKSPRRLLPVSMEFQNRGWAPSYRPNVIVENGRLRVRIGYVYWVDGEKALYDQPVIYEPKGSVILPVDVPTGRLGLIAAQRPLAVDQEAYRAAFLDPKTGCPDIPESSLGVVLQEAPRGLPKWAETARQTAERETAEETGGRVISIERLPIDTSPNTTYFVQTVDCFLATLDLSRPGTPDEEEGIGKFQFVSLAEYAELMESKDSPDSMTGYLVAWLLIRRPGLLR